MCHQPQSGAGANRAARTRRRGQGFVICPGCGLQQPGHITKQAAASSSCSLLLARARSEREEVAPALVWTAPVLYCRRLRSSAACLPPVSTAAWRLSSENSANAPPAA